MRHFIVSHPVTASALSVREAPAATALVTLGGFTQVGAAGRLRTAAGAIDLAAIAAAANEHLRPAAGTQEEAARGLHRRSPWNAEDRDRYRQGARAVEYCGCTFLCPAPWPDTRVLCGRDIGVNLAVC